MKLSASVEINKPMKEVWKAITNFKNCATYIEGINRIEVLNEPKDTLVGFKWKETRTMFGKEATEIMWITDYKDNKYYQARAKNHGSIYTSRLSVEDLGDTTRLEMSFTGEAQTKFVKIISLLMEPLMKGAMKKMILKDLEDIKSYLEKNN